MRSGHQKILFNRKVFLFFICCVNSYPIKTANKAKNQPRCEKSAAYCQGKFSSYLLISLGANISAGSLRSCTVIEKLTHQTVLAN